ncbi:MAG: acetate kinase [Bacteroidetes bacterium 4484_249]|nr:MAG: acetate kinase [Bacteroidetes bacterium 4484_249]
MKILVINTGSSSIKYELIDMGNQQVLSSGIAEKIGEQSSTLNHKAILDNGQSVNKTEKNIIADHNVGMRRIVELLCDDEYGAIESKSEIDAVGHRVVHGGEAFQTSTIITKDVIAALEENIPLAPLHNPPNLTGIEVATSIFPDAIQVAVFDTAFHQSLPEKAYLYALPFELYEKYKIRRYGFHGTSHAYVAEKAAEYLNKPLSELNLITIHIGNGASMTAIKNGKSVDTSMGMTPLAGLMMGTRTGDIDPAIPLFLTNQLGISLKEIDGLMNKQSGLKGICGTNDMREVIEKKNSGDAQAGIALEIYTYRIKKYIGAYFAALGSVDAIIYTAGVGEHSPYIREQSCKGLFKLGIMIDTEKNNAHAKGLREINTTDSEVKILIIPTNEELKIAMETKRVIKS